ncbi:TRAP transporter large permease subunit [Roseivirga sp. BDSF3-8]|uniref:TRAP transporter large permease n=1 Tax=Roseivirga sp. BDSF3-8 TaxID=3241598 RepID=UPI003531FABA
MFLELLPIILFASIFAMILWGYPVAFTLGGISVLFGLVHFGPDFFLLLPLRVYGTMTNYVLIAVPLFIFMGIMLEKSGLAESLLETMSMLFGRMRGGLAISVVVVGAMLAASTGIVGATVITMGLISLPVMLKRGYSIPLSTGTIAASGTLGQIIPPSIVLVLLGSVLNVSVGDLFAAALAPGLLLVGCYLAYILVMAAIRPGSLPAMPAEEIREFRSKGMWKRIVKAFLLPFFLIGAVLGSIFAGIASPTEAAALGAFGATVLTLISGRLSLKILKQVTRETTHLTCMVFLILIGATAFTLVFRRMDGDAFLINAIEQSNLSPYTFLFIVMLVVFIAGFFIDFIEIIFIIVPVVAPIFVQLEMDLIWIGVLLALNLQTSFLSPPFGFSLFYLKGVAPPQVKTSHLYKGIIPFVLIQLVFILIVVLFPQVLAIF